MRRRLPPWAVIAIVSFFASLAIGLAFGLNLLEESWWAQLVARTRAGEVLYRDAMLNVPPLSVYLTRAVAWAAGSEVLGVKLAASLVFAGTVAVAAWINSRLGGSPRSNWMLAAALLLFAFVPAYPPGTSLATLFLLLTMGSVLRVTSGEGDSRRFLVVGGFAGLAFMSEQWIGILALAAAVIALFVAGLSPGGRRWAWLGGGFVVAVGLALVPIAISGGAGAFVRHGLVDLGGSPRLGFHYMDALSRLYHSVVNLDRPNLYLGIGLLVPPVALVALVIVAIQRRMPRDRLAVLGSFSLAVCLGALSAFDERSVRFATPVLLVAVFAAGRALRSDKLSKARTFGRRAIGVGLGAAVLVLMISTGINLSTSGYQLSDLAHFDGIPVTDGFERSEAENADTLRTVVEDKGVFFLSPRAGFLYLVTGLRNPTRYDYPGAPVLGERGQSEIIQSIRQGRVDVVCQEEFWRMFLPPERRPSTLERFVRTQMSHVGSAGSCEFYVWSSQEAEGLPGIWPALELSDSVTELAHPVDIVNAGDGSGRLYVAENGGRIRIVEDGRILPDPLLDIRSLVECQKLLSVAFPPGYTAPGEFYVAYQDHECNLVVARYQTDLKGLAVPTSRDVVLTVPMAVPGVDGHAGSKLLFGPDGYLYVSIGDGSLPPVSPDPKSKAQDLMTLLGKVLRIDVGGPGPYAIPPNNPFVGDPNARPEIWAYGLRNPWRMSFDSSSGDLFIGDVGELDNEEIDLQPASSLGGENYGWKIMEGGSCFETPNCDTTGLTMPVAEYEHLDGDCSLSAGVTPHSSSSPQLEGVFLYGDYCSGRIWGLRHDAGWESHEFLDSEMMITGFGLDEDGEIWVADFQNGEIHRISQTPIPDRESQGAPSESYPT